MKHTYPKNIKTPAQRKAYRTRVRKEQDQLIAEVGLIWDDGTLDYKQSFREIRDRFIITRRK